MFQKIKQQLQDNLILTVLLVFAAFGSYRSTQVKVELNDMTELHKRLVELEEKCAEMDRMREEMDDLRFAFAKAVSRPGKTASNRK